MYLNSYGAVESTITRGALAQRVAPVRKLFAAWAIANGLKKRTSVFSNGKLTGEWAGLDAHPAVVALLKDYEGTMRNASNGLVTGQGLTDKELAVLGTFVQMPAPSSDGKISGVWNTAVDASTGKVVMTCVGAQLASGAEPRGPCSDFSDKAAYDDCLSKYGKPCGAALRNVFVPNADITKIAADAPVIAVLKKAVESSGGSVPESQSAGSSLSVGKIFAGLAVAGLAVAIVKGRK